MDDFLIGIGLVLFITLAFFADFLINFQSAAF